MYKFKCEDLDLTQTLDCGQAFRWENIDGVYRGHALSDSGDRFLKISQDGAIFTAHNVGEREFHDFWYNYFDLGKEYSVIKKRLSKDQTLKLAVEQSFGLRLLRQNPWETLISFIISQNNNIPRIKLIISRMCELFGGFPSSEQLFENDLAFLRAGFRERYIKDAAAKIMSEEVVLDNRLPTEQLRVELMKIKGVGKKVADCVMLYGLQKTDAFPIDIWIRRALDNFYPQEKGGFPKEFDDINGIAQLFLFNFIRAENSGVKLPSISC